jgi:hypothetical protein
VTFDEIFVSGFSSLAHSMYLNIKMMKKDGKDIPKEYKEEYDRVCASYVKLTGKSKVFQL